MKKRTKFIQTRIARGATLMALAAITNAAYAADPVNYVGVHGGVNNLKNWSANVDLGGGVNLPGDVSLGSGLHVGVALGRQTENARYELEFQRGKFDVTAIQLGGVREAVSGSGSYQAFTLNAYRTEAFNPDWTGYAGVGIGWGKASLPQLGFSGGCNCFAAASENGLVYQGRLGMEYKLQERNHAFVQYTLLSLPKNSSGGSPGTTYDRKNIGIVSVGYRHVFQ